MPTPTKDPEILIIGAGPTGLTLACDLARRRISHRIIDHNEHPSQHSKALAIHARTLECFEQIGLTNELCRRGRKIYVLNLYADEQRLARLDFQHLNTPYPFVLVLPQRETEHLLNERLISYGGRVERPVQLVAMEPLTDHVRATMHDQRANSQHDSVSASWVVGCDGAHSSVRTNLDLPFQGASYENSFLLGDLTLEGDIPSDEAHIFLSPYGLLLAIPLPERHHFRVVIDETYAPSSASDTDLTLSDFQTFWSQRVGDGPGADSRLSQLDWHSRFRISRRLVSSYRKGRVFLAGDAAHVHSPAGGQGMNTGIQDAFNLGWKLELVHHGLSPESLLDSYQEERRPVAASILSRTHWGTHIMTLRHPLLRWIRNHAVSFLCHSPALQQKLAYAMAELDIHYGKSSIIDHQSPSTTKPSNWKKAIHSVRTGRQSPLPPKSGERVPDVTFRGAYTETCRVYDLLRGPHHTLLLFSGFDTGPFSQGVLDTIDRLVEGRFAPHIQSHLVFTTDHRSARLPASSLVHDIDGTLHRRFGADQCCAYVIRPDGYVGYTSQPIQAVRLQDYLSKIFPNRNIL